MPIIIGNWLSTIDLNRDGLLIRVLMRGDAYINAASNFLNPNASSCPEIISTGDRSGACVCASDVWIKEVVVRNSFISISLGFLNEHSTTDGTGRRWNWVRSDGVCSAGVPFGYGSRTLSITWITPFEPTMSVAMTLDLLT